MDRIDCLHVRMLFHDAPNGSEHSNHGLTQALASMRSEEDETGSLRPVEVLIMIALAHCCSECIDAGVARHENPSYGFTFVEQVALRSLSWTSTAWRLNSSGQGEYRFRVRSPAST